jgi:hypothetical protein
LEEAHQMFEVNHGEEYAVSAVIDPPCYCIQGKLDSVLLLKRTRRTEARCVFLEKISLMVTA